MVNSHSSADLAIQVVASPTCKAELESETNIQKARDEHPPHAIQSIANTSVLALRYRTRVESRWR
ncbi:DUF7386 family protein [Saliphagus infecundisoli]|uniref:DUF7386 family protein n=1 Tax=Saliphagus infecundisoli TaxID=1849069 RepID=UPI003CCE417C